MESEDYKEMCKIVIRQINNRKDELNKAVQHETKNSIGKPIKDIRCNDCFMRRTHNNLEQNVEPKDLFCHQAKLDIHGSLFLPDDFSKKLILICRHAYDEINQEGFFDGNIIDRQHEYRLKVQKEMKFLKRRFFKQDRNREKNKKFKIFLEKIELDKDEDEDCPMLR